MERFEKLYIRFVVPVWTAILLFFAGLWTWSAVVEHDIPLAGALCVLYLVVIGFIVSDVLLWKGKRAGEILNIITVFVSMGLVGGLFGVKAYNLFLEDMARALTSGFCSFIAVLIHSAVLIYCIHFRRGKAMQEEEEEDDDA